MSGVSGVMIGGGGGGGRSCDIECAGDICLI